MPATPEHLHRLLTYCIDFGREMLTDAGEFLPFAATLDADGAIAALVLPDGDPFPEPRKLHRQLGEALRDRAANGSIAAAALAVIVDIPGEYEPPVPDGIRVLLESSDFSRYIYIPYAIRKRGFIIRRNEVTVYEPIPVALGPGIFGNR